MRSKIKLEIDTFDTVAATNASNIDTHLALSLLGYYQPYAFILGSSYQITDKLMISFKAEIPAIVRVQGYCR